MTHVKKIVVYEGVSGSDHYKIYLKDKYYNIFSSFEGNVYVIPKRRECSVSINGITNIKFREAYSKVYRSKRMKKLACSAIKRLKFESKRDKARYKITI